MHPHIINGIEVWDSSCRTQLARSRKLIDKCLKNLTYDAESTVLGCLFTMCPFLEGTEAVTFLKTLLFYHLSVIVIAPLRDLRIA